MTARYKDKERDRRLLLVLAKLASVPEANLLELGFSATAQFIRGMAANGLVRVRVEITERGRARMKDIHDRELRRKHKEAQQAKIREVA